jgi:hypothetical protein
VDHGGKTEHQECAGEPRRRARGNQRSRGVVTARVQTDIVQSLHHQHRDL